LEKVPVYASSNTVFNAAVTRAWILFQTAAEKIKLQLSKSQQYFGVSLCLVGTRGSEPRMKLVIVAYVLIFSDTYLHAFFQAVPGV